MNNTLLDVIVGGSLEEKVHTLSIIRSSFYVENIKGAIKYGQSRETGNIWCTRRRQTKQKHNTICVEHH
jgi:hypothetical protein